ncbi:BQ5605_C035g11455 [Microbotryum silenes-dioicae]|uniref:BQ5605_C035g11455 protein n=1 Tax=Microbotryum silenes-dioicae TaxID=796604 RepID=A0A2X0MJ66_9BASI|nr:BQ5605_C039g11749 [Microbotryum silenes-dioicae]SGY98289.1 BQ5605_C035g11455 [Microbotryum silenes-dioicae]
MQAQQPQSTSIGAVGKSRGQKRPRESPSSQAPKRPRVRYERDDDEGEDVRGDLAVRGLPMTNNFVLVSTALRHSAMIDDPLCIVLGAFMAGMFARSAGEDAGSGSMSSEGTAKLRWRRSQADPTRLTRWLGLKSRASRALVSLPSSSIFHPQSCARTQPLESGSSPPYF